ncbi:uncharacterized protein LOC135332186 isoform X1 [Halichondria panicea]|uniref:uncharacterized protein LOC135332186 isoform X1 n=2 Tax=Halichondria panicea TaxID=6063 RepID=UPI00312B5029
MANRRKRPHHSFDCYLGSPEEKQALQARIERVRKKLSPAGRTIDNLSLINAMLDAVEEKLASADEGTPTSDQGSVRPFLRDNGMYTGDNSPDDQTLFITEKRCFDDLMTGLASSCSVRSCWRLDSVIQKGHVIRVLYSCRHCRHQKRSWSSSRVFGGHFLVNQKMVHSFTCAGIIPSQYIHLSMFAGLGTVGHAYIRRVYNNNSYLEIVAAAAEHSMQSAVEEVKALPHYSTKGEWVITDARHDSTANAYHTTVPCLSGSTHKILGISTISRTEHSVAQTRELQCTKVVLPQVIARGLNVTEVGHDMQAQVAKYVTHTLNLINSYDTWHGTKNVARELKKITEGRVRDRNITWFPELSDKRRSIKIHLYWAMKNCGEDPNILQQMALNIPNHYKGDHSNCHASSPCRMAPYIPSRAQITNKKAEEELLRCIKATYVFKNADAFCRCRDTFWVESFNHQLLIYLSKRIHYSDETFLMRMNLAVLDWNENVNRAHTSKRKVKDLRRPDRRTDMKALVSKSYHFAGMLWTEYVARNGVDLSEFEDIEPDGDNDEDWLTDGMLPPLLPSDDMESDSDSDDRE